jgi:RND superfamily putative drug exporter
METKMKLNLTARAARWSAGHWKTATLAWIAFVAVAVGLGTVAGKVGLSDSEQSTGEAARAESILQDAGFKQPAGESVLIQNTHLAASDGRFAGTVRRVVAGLKAHQQVTNLKAPVTAKDGHSVLVNFAIRGDANSAADRVQPVLNTVANLERGSPGYTIVESGDASSDKQVAEKTNSDLQKAEQLSLPITFLILLFAFGAFVAAGLPVLLAFSAVLASIGLDALTSHVWHASDAASSVILLIGMAVGVDYSLFYVKREREERRAGLSGRDAVTRAGATSGLAVLVSGATVLIAMAGMLISGSAIFTSLGIASMVVVASAMIGSLTVLPALLGKLGDRIDRGVIGVLAAVLYRLGRLGRVDSRLLARVRDRRTILQRLKGDDSRSRIWEAALRPVLRHPLVSALAATWVLVVLALPVLSIHTKLPGPGDLPKSIPVVDAYSKIDKAFPGSQIPAVVVVKAPNVDAPRVRTALASLRREAIETGEMTGPVSTTVNPTRTVARIEIPLRGNGEDARSVHALSTLRNTVLPSTIGRVPGAEVAVTGETAGNHDFGQTMKSRFPFVFAFVLGLAFLLLLVTFRSIVVPLTAIALNLLSVAAAYGVLVSVFQDGHLQSLLGFHSNGAVVTWLPVFLFVVLFALSMDYHVFIVSRIKELVDRGVPTDEAVERGIRTTASTVTSAAAVMVAVFAIFATLSDLGIKQMGFGLAVAVLLDATIIRGVLLPATMKLLGRANWYLPRAFGWLPKLNLETTRPVTEVD